MGLSFLKLRIKKVADFDSPQLSKYFYKIKIKLYS